MIFGTPEYMSPEQAAGKSLDHRVDIYALSVILYELLTGRVPFSGDTFMGVLTQHMFETPPALWQANPALQVPESVEAFIRKGLAKDPGERFQTCDEMITALEQAVRGVSPSSPPPPGKATQLGFGEPSKPVAPLGRPPAATEELAPTPERPNHALLFVGLGLVATALAGGAYYVLVHGDPGGEPPGTTEPTTRAAIPDAAVAPTPDAFVEPDAAAPSDAGPQRISVGVVTTPPGARVELLGAEGVGCEATPCNLMLPLGEHVRLQAHLRNRSATVEVDVVRDMAPVTIAIRPRPSSGGGGDDPGGTTSIGPLKIPTVLEGPRTR
jgi:serine/threonine-protein kinase